MVYFLIGFSLGAIGGMIVIADWSIRKIYDLEQENSKLKIDLLRK